MGRFLVGLALLCLLAMAVVPEEAQASQVSLRRLRSRLLEEPLDAGSMTEQEGSIDITNEFNSQDEDDSNDKLSEVEEQTDDATVDPEDEKQDEEPSQEEFTEIRDVEANPQPADTSMKFQQVNVGQRQAPQQASQSASSTTAAKKSAQSTDSVMTVESIILDAQQSAAQASPRQGQGQVHTDSNMGKGNEKDQFSIWRKQSLVEQQNIMQKALVQIRKIEAKSLKDIAQTRLEWETKERRAAARMKAEEETRNMQRAQ